MRRRMSLIATEPGLSFGAAEHYADWERAVSEFAGRRLGQPAESLYPLAIGRTVLAACRAAYDRWSDRADNDLPTYLDAALAALASGFDPVPLRAAPVPRPLALPPCLLPAPRRPDAAPVLLTAAAREADALLRRAWRAGPEEGAPGGRRRRWRRWR